MGTIAPRRLFNATNATSLATPSQQNCVVVSEEPYRRVPTCQNGTPNTLNGPPPSAHRASAKQGPPPISLTSCGRRWSRGRG